MYLKIAAGLTIFIGLAHSYLGEKYILTRLFKRSLPKLFGGESFTKNTLRFAWHITTLAWLGIAAILWKVSINPITEPILLTIAWTFCSTALVAFIASKGRHLSWVVFIAIAILIFVAA